MFPITKRSIREAPSKIVLKSFVSILAWMEIGGISMSSLFSGRIQRMWDPAKKRLVDCETRNSGRLERVYISSSWKIYRRFHVSAEQIEILIEEPPRKCSWYILFYVVLTPLVQAAGMVYDSAMKQHRMVFFINRKSNDIIT